jgi:hypothetical protein
LIKNILTKLDQSIKMSTKKRKSIAITTETPIEDVISELYESPEEIGSSSVLQPIDSSTSPPEVFPEIQTIEGSMATEQLSYDKASVILDLILSDSALTHKFLPAILAAGVEFDQVLDIFTNYSMPKPCVGAELIALNIVDPETIIDRVINGIAFASEYNNNPGSIDAYIKFIDDNQIEGQYLMDSYTQSHFNILGNYSGLLEIKKQYFQEILKRGATLDAETFMKIIKLDNLLSTDNINFAKLLFNSVCEEIPDEYLMDNFIFYCKMCASVSYYGERHYMQNIMLNYLTLFGDRLMTDEFYLILFMTIRSTLNKTNRKIFKTYAKRFEANGILITLNTKDNMESVTVNDLITCAGNITPDLYTKHQIKHFDFQIEKQILVYWLAGNYKMLSSGLFDLNSLDWSTLDDVNISEYIKCVGVIIEILISMEAIENDTTLIKNFMDLLHNMNCIDKALVQVWMGSDPITALRSAQIKVVDLLIEHGADIYCLQGVEQKYKSGILEKHLKSKGLEFDEDNVDECTNSIAEIAIESELSCDLSDV